jgi:hypothetical protein
MAQLLVYALLLAMSIHVVAAWLRWLSGNVKLAKPQWRSAVTTFGFAMSTSSLMLIIVLAVHAFITGGFPYYHPTLVFAFVSAF